MNRFWLTIFLGIFILNPTRVISDNESFGYFEDTILDVPDFGNLEHLSVISSVSRLCVGKREDTAVEATESLAETRFNTRNLFQIDTITPTKEYMGYRLFVSNIQVIKKSEDWIRLQLTAVNTGRNNVNFNQKGTEHWVQFQFDNSLFDSKLGGQRDQIRYAFYEAGFKLKAGKIAKNIELKVNTMPPVVNRKIIDPNPKRVTPIIKDELVEKTVQPKDSTEQEIVEEVKQEKPEKNIAQHKIQCPDLIIEEIKVLNQSKKWATIEYTLANIGEGPVDLLERVGSDKIKLAVRAHISGVSTLSKGALSIGGGFVGQDLNSKNITLYPNERHKEQLKLDIRSKTRYMKTVILSLDTHELRYECDRTNNTKAIELE